VEQVAKVLGRVAQQEQIDIDGAALALIARHATGSFRDALGTLEQLVTYAGEERIQSADVLAVLGVADAEQLFAAIDATVARDPAAALRAAGALAESGRDPGQVLRDLEVHARELLTVQILGEVPQELRVTPERDRRLTEQAQALSETDVVRLLDLVGVALEATTNGAQARIQLELVLIKSAAPEVDPSTAALLARIERLEASVAGGAGAGSARAAPTAAAVPTAAAEPEAETVTSAPEAKRAPTVQTAPPARTAPPVQTAPAAQTAVATAPAPGAALDLPAIVQLWPAVVDVVRGENAMLAALLADARPTGASERELTLAFPPGAAFLKRKAEQDDYRRIAADALRTVTGQALPLRYELRELEQAEVQAEGQPQLSGEELVRRFLEEFDAEELHDDEPDEREANN
jgi:DNA polymerase-3 subunit gamma/tau